MMRFIFVLDFYAIIRFCLCRKCAMIAAHYGFSDVFDNLIISLCKFTTLSSEVRPLSDTKSRPQICLCHSIK